MTNEDRIKRMMEMAEEDKPKEGCGSCRYYQNNTSWPHITDRCKNPVVKRAHPYGGETAEWARGNNGICGPDRLLYVNRGIRVLLPQYRKGDGMEFLNIMLLVISAVFSLVITTVFIASLS